MTAYNTSTLENIYVREQATKAGKKNLITPAELAAIKDSHPVDLYTPNRFVKIGLAILTCFISLCITGLFFLLFVSGGSGSGLMIFLAIVTYIVLEIMTGIKKHYNSGVDNVLMFACAIFIISGIGFNNLGSNGEILISLVMLLITGWYTVRFADSLAASFAALSFLGFVFSVYISLGAFAMATFPYLLMAVSAALYFYFNNLSKDNTLIIYKNAFANISVVALFAFYFSGIVNVVAELTKSADLSQAGSVFSAWWFFWTWTMVLPWVYVAGGIIKKSMLLIRVGAILMAFSIITFHETFNIISAEALMTIAGGGLLVISYLLMRYLRSPKHGFVFDNYSRIEDENNNFEALIPGLVQGSQHAPAEQTKFGGGSFGGAGGGGDY